MSNILLKLYKKSILLDYFIVFNAPLRLKYCSVAQLFVDI